MVFELNKKLKNKKKKLKQNLATQKLKKVNLILKRLFEYYISTNLAIIRS